MERGGITWLLDDSGELIPESVGYICQDCGGFFDDSNKTELGQMGKWIATAKPSRPGYYSYHINSLYSPVYMSSWEDYVRDWMEANPIGGNRDESKWKVFVNQVLGETYEQITESISANVLQQNIRPYQIGLLPEKQSLADGNGKIVLITLGSDLNGKDDSYKNHDEDDARLDWEIIAHSESGATYSISHGSIGTFIPNQTKEQKSKTDRKKYTYKHGTPNSVWGEFQEIISAVYSTDTGRKMRIMCSGLDCGAYTSYAYTFIDNCNGIVYGMKGKDMDKFISQNKDIKLFKQAQERG
ncbi:MAG: phage terminase large subunit family protein, partial [Nanoarchaeota archaeon]|nr:phage terminase large subunit family protein [Nanoarchaeota archaeon]